MPLIPAPPMPIRWTCVAQLGPVDALDPVAHPITSSTIRAIRSSASPWPASRARRPISSARAGVGEQRHQLGQRAVAGQLLVRDEDPAAVLDDGCDVQRLLPVAVRQRHVDGGQPDGGQLGHRRHRRSARARRPPRRRRGPSARCRAAGGSRASAGRARRCGRARAARRRPASTSPGSAAATAAVQRARALRAAEHEQHRPAGRQPEVLAGLAAQGGPVQRRDRAAQRHADDLLVRQAGARDGDADGLREPRADLVRQPGAGVRLVHDDRGPAARAEVRRAARRTRRTRRRRPRPRRRGPRGPASRRRGRCPGSFSRSAVGLRGNGTGGISSSG